MKFVVRTDAMKSPAYFAGAVNLNVGAGFVITNLIFDAWVFKSRKEAEKLIKEILGEDWSISEMGEPKASKNLMNSAAPSSPIPKP